MLIAQRTACRRSSPASAVGPLNALAASADGQIVVGAQQIATGAQLIAWQVSGVTLTEVGHVEFGGSATALAITNAP